jgi:uncharacterized protein YbcV (DUF1398 family)
MRELERVRRQHGVESTSHTETARRHTFEEYVARVTARADGRVSLSELAADIVSSEDDATDVENPSERIDRVRITLYHEHVPRLADEGVVDWCRDDGEIHVTRDGTDTT